MTMRRSARPLAVMISPAQCRAARALLGWPKEWLASEPSVSTRTIAEFEKGASAPRQTKCDALRRALAKAGVEFLDEDLNPRASLLFGDSASG